MVFLFFPYEEKTEDLLNRLVALIQENHKKKLKRCFVKIFRQMTIEYAKDRYGKFKSLINAKKNDRRL